MAGDPTSNLEHLAIAESLTIAEVVGAASSFQRPQGENVRLREIDNVHVVTDTSSIWRWVIVTIDRESITAALSHPQHQWNDVSLRLMLFAYALCRSGGVEIVQGRVMKSVQPLIPFQCGFQHVLRFAVGRARIHGLIVWYRHLPRVLEEV